MICNPCVSHQSQEHEWLCSSCIYDCNDCNECQSSNIGACICDSNQTYNKIVNICTINFEYISYEESWKPIIDAINEIYEFEKNKTGTKTIDSKITNTNITNAKIALSLYNEAQSRLHTPEHNQNDIIYGTYFKDLTDALKNNKFHSSLCDSCNAVCNNCNSCQNCNGSCQNSYGYYCTQCDNGMTPPCQNYYVDESECQGVMKCVN